MPLLNYKQEIPCADGKAEGRASNAGADFEVPITGISVSSAEWTGGELVRPGSIPSIQRRGALRPGGELPVLIRMLRAELGGRFGASSARICQRFQLLGSQ